MVLAGCALALSVAMGNTRKSSCSPAEGKAGQKGCGAVRSNAHPTAIATWRFGKIAVDAAADLLQDGRTALDATEAGNLVRATVH